MEKRPDASQGEDLFRIQLQASTQSIQKTLYVRIILTRLLNPILMKG